MNPESTADNSTPVRRTARARKVNSRFVGEDADEGYRKLVDRITASDSLREKEHSTLAAVSKLTKNNASRSSSRATSTCEEFDENSNFGSERDATNVLDATKHRSTSGASHRKDDCLAATVNSNVDSTKGNERVELGAKSSSQIFKYRSSTDTDSEDEGKVTDPIEQELMRLDEGLLPAYTESAKHTSELSHQNPASKIQDENTNDDNKHDELLGKKIDKSPKIILSTKTSMESIPGRKIKILSLKPITLKSSIPSAMRANNLELKLVTSPDSTTKVFSSPTSTVDACNKVNNSASQQHSSFTSDGEDDVPLNKFVKKPEEFPFEDTFKFVKKPGESLVSKILKSDSLIRRKSTKTPLSSASKLGKMEKKVKEVPIKKGKANKPVKPRLKKASIKMIKRTNAKSNDTSSPDRPSSNEEQDDVPLKLLMRKDKENIDSINPLDTSISPNDSTLYDHKQDNEQDEMPLNKLFQIDAIKSIDALPSGGKKNILSKDDPLQNLTKDKKQTHDLMKDTSKVKKNQKPSSKFMNKPVCDSSGLATLESPYENSDVDDAPSIKDSSKIVASKKMPSRELPPSKDDNEMQSSSSQRAAPSKSQDVITQSIQEDHTNISTDASISVTKKNIVPKRSKSGKVIKKRFRGLDTFPSKKTKKSFKISSGLFSPKKADLRSSSASFSGLKNKTRYIKVEENGQEYVLMQNYGDYGIAESGASLSTNSKPLTDELQAKSTFTTESKNSKKEKILSDSSKNLQTNSGRKRKSLFSSNKKRKRNKDILKNLKKKRFRSLDTDATPLQDSAAPKDVQSITPGSKLISLSSLVLEIPLKECNEELDKIQSVITNSQKADHSKESKSVEIPKVKKSPPRIKIKVRRHSKTLEMSNLSIPEKKDKDSSLRKLNDNGTSSAEAPNKQLDVSYSSEQQGAHLPVASLMPEKMALMEFPKEKLAQQTLSSESGIKSPKNAVQEKRISKRDSIDDKTEIDRKIPSSESKFVMERDENISKASPSSLRSPEGKTKVLDNSFKGSKEKLNIADSPQKSHDRQQSAEAKGKHESIDKDIKKKHRISVTESKEKQIDSPSKTKPCYDSKDKVFNSEDIKKKQDSPSKTENRDDTNKNILLDSVQKVKSKDQTQGKLKFSESLFLRDLEIKDKDKNFFVKKKSTINKDKLKEPESKERPRYPFLKGNVGSKDRHQELQATHKVKDSSDSYSQEAKEVQYRSSSRDKFKDSRKDRHDEKKQENERILHHYRSDSKERRRDSRDRHRESRSKERIEELDKFKHRRYEERFHRYDTDYRGQRTESRHGERDKNKDSDNKNKYRKFSKDSSWVENSSKFINIDKKEKIIPPLIGVEDDPTYDQHSPLASKKKPIVSEHSTETLEQSQTMDTNSYGKNEPSIHKTSLEKTAELPKTNEQGHASRDIEGDAKILDISSKLNDNSLEIKLPVINESSPNMELPKPNDIENIKEVDSSQNNISIKTDYHTPTKELIEGSTDLQSSLSAQMEIEPYPFTPKPKALDKDNEIPLLAQSNDPLVRDLKLPSKENELSLKETEGHENSSLNKVTLKDDKEEESSLEQPEQLNQLKDNKTCKQQVKLESKDDEENNLFDANIDSNLKVLKEDNELESISNLLENQESPLKNEKSDVTKKDEPLTDSSKATSQLIVSKSTTEVKKSLPSISKSKAQSIAPTNQFASFGLASLLQRMRQEPKEQPPPDTCVDMKEKSSYKFKDKKENNSSLKDSSFKEPLAGGANIPASKFDSKKNDTSQIHSSFSLLSSTNKSEDKALPQQFSFSNLRPEKDIDDIFDSPISPPSNDAKNVIPKASPQRFMTKIYKDNLDFVYSLGGKEQVTSNNDDLADQVKGKLNEDDANGKKNAGSSRSTRRSNSDSPKLDDEGKLDSKKKSDIRGTPSSDNSKRNKKRQLQFENIDQVNSNSGSSDKEDVVSKYPEAKVLANVSQVKKSRWDNSAGSVASNSNKDMHSIDGKWLMFDKGLKKLDKDPSSSSPNPPSEKESKEVNENQKSPTETINKNEVVSLLEDNKENLLPPSNESLESPLEDEPTQKKELSPEELAEAEKRNAKIIADRMKSFELLEENIYLAEKKKCKRSKEVRRMLCDCSLTKEEMANDEMGCGEDCLNRMLMIECGPRCPLKDHCTNRQFQQKKNAKVEVFNAENKGCGVRICEDLSPGTFIMEYIGEVFDTREFKRRRKEYAKGSSAHFYFMALRSDQLIDATRKGNISRFVNHSCDPNCETQKWTVNGELRIGFFATKSISSGEEINFDYRLERYGREPQRCFCGTPFCRGWLGEPPDEKTKEEKEEDRKKELKDKKRKEERRLYIEDMDLEEEIEKLNESGLRNRQDTLDLSRLMVRAEEIQARVSLLLLLKTGEPACRRLFLDYHGLKLLWSWMADIGHSSKNAPLKLEILTTLECLPITNKTQLTDSRILNIVERWSKQSTESKSSPGKASPDSSVQKSHAQITTKKSSDTSEDSDTEAAESSETPSPDESSLDANETSAEKGNESSTPSLDSSTITDLSKDSSVAADSSIAPQAKQENENIPSVSLADVVGFAQKLLPTWISLSEAFRIPKKERIEMMKEHEREVDKGYREYLAREKPADKDRYEGWGNSRDRSREKRRERRRNERSQREIKDMDDEDKGLTKEERREKFEKLVAKQDEERLLKLQQEMWALHLQRCSLLGHNPYLTPIFDPTGQFYWDPGNMSWQAYVGPDPNLPVPANYGAPEPSTKSPQDIIDEQHQFMAGAFYPLPHPSLPEGDQSTPTDSIDMDLSTIPLPGEVPLPPSPGNSPPDDVAIVSIPLPGEVGESFGARGAETSPLPPPGSVTITLPPKWKIARNSDGYLYFYHSKTRVSQWNIPSADQHKQLMAQFGFTTNSDSESESESSSSSSSDSEYFSSEEEEEAEEEEVTVVRSSDGTCEKMVRNAKSKRRRSERLVQERVISPIMFEDREAARRERREAKVRAREEARIERWQLYRSLKEQQRISSLASKREKQGHSSLSARQEDDGAPDSPKDDDDHLDLQLLKFSKRQKLNEGRGHQKGKSKERMVTAMADNSDNARKIKDNFRAKMATYIVSVLNPYRRSDCKEGRIVNTEDFKYLARKLTHFVMVKELKQLPSIEGLEYSESVKHKTKEFVRKYMGKYGSKFKRDPNDTKEY